MRPVIIGAGPIGSYTAMKLESLNPIIFEEHKQVGLPCHCAGLISKRLTNLINVPDELILNKISGAKLFSQKECVTIDAHKTMAYVINRTGFDKYLSDLSKADLRLGEPVINYQLKNGLMNVKTGKQVLKTELVIDCSGPKKPLNYVIGLQVRAKLKRDPQFVELYFDYPGFFAWVIPESNGICRIGLGVNKNPSDYLNSFLKRLSVKKVIDKQAGLIPLSVKPFCFDNLIMIGDAAGQVKSITGGGIITGLLSAEVAASSVLKAYEYSTFSKSFFINNYQKPWSKSIGRELKIHYFIRRLMNKFNYKDYDLLIRFLMNNKKTIELYGDMDFPSKFLFKLLRPKNLIYGLKLLSKTFKN